MNQPKPNKTAWTKRSSLAVNKPGQGAFTFIELLVVIAIIATSASLPAVGNVGLSGISTPISPEITSQPQSKLASPGGKVEFAVVATGSAPLTYQWYQNNTLLSGKTSSTLAINNVLVDDAGEYKVSVGNDGGSITSSIVTLDVYAGALTAGLVAHYKFENDYLDASGRGNDGTEVGAPTFVEGKIGGFAMSFTSLKDGSSFNYVTLGTPADLDFGSDTDFSVSFWGRVAADVQDDPPFISNKNWNSGGNQGYVINTGGDRRLAYNFSGPPGGRKDFSKPAVFEQDTWHHIVLTFKRNLYAATYVDGALVSQKDISTGANSLTTPAGQATNLGQDGTGHYTDGGNAEIQDAALDDVGFWRRVLTPQEAGAIYSAGLTGKDLSQAVVGAPVIPPSITTQPASKTATEGTAASFTVAASGTPTLHYQWKHGPTAILNASDATLVISPVKASDAGSYTVVVSNDNGDTATSDPATLTVLPAPPLLATGQWDFNAGDLRATIGQDLEYRGDTGGLTTFVDATIGGELAKVMSFPATSPSQGFIMHHGAVPNGDGAFVNRYTLIMDLMFPTESTGKWRALLQTSTANANDGDFFVNNGNGIGISGQYQGRILPNTWHRVVASVNLNDRTLSKYIDGILVNRQTLSSGVDGRYSLNPFALLFTDEDGETAAGFVNSIQFRNGVMTDAEVAALGSPTAAGIPRPGATRSGSVVGINWTDGTAPFLVERKSKLSDSAWVKLLTTVNQSAIVAIQGDSGFFRVTDKATATVVPFTAYLDGASEKPNAVTTPGSGTASFALEGNTLWYYVSYANLSSGATAAHIHGPATSSQAAGVMIGLPTPVGTAGFMTGFLTLTDPQKANLLAGKTYLNIHTSVNPGGEIRGQIGATDLKVVLNGANERPTPVVTPAIGSGTITRVGNKLFYNINYSGLSADATGAHIHGPADANATAGVLVPLSGAVGTSGTLSGVVTLSAAGLGALVDGLTYVNIHTTLNGGGEIRGQVAP